jgi:hypothetical protein
VLKFGIWDDDFDGDEQAGSIILNVKELIHACDKNENNDNHFKWINIYGAPGQEGLTRSGNQDQAKMMNNNPTIASKWSGRILISF